MADGALIGRAPESRRLTDLIRRIPGQGGALVLHGEAGVGKSALLTEAAALAVAEGLRVLTAVGAETEEHLPFAGLHQIVHPVRAGLLALPALQREALQGAMGMTDQAVPDVYLVGLAVLNVLAETAAQTPVLIVAEDAHWLDRASAEVLAFVARRLDSEPIALIAAVRDGIPSRLSAAALPSMAVTRLSERDSATLLDLVAPHLDQALRQRLLTEAAGIPLALTELPKAVAVPSGAFPSESLPLTERLERAFTDRVAQLPGSTRAILPIAALNDSASVAETLEAAAVILGAAVGMAALIPAVDARLIELGAHTITFRHPLMRSAIAQATNAIDRQRVHGALAQVLGARPDRRAWHRAAATWGTDESVAAELDTLANSAQRRGGVSTAVAALEQAARLSAVPARRAERLLRAADLAVESGRRDVVLRVLHEATLLGLSPQDRARVAWIRGGFDDGMRDDAAGAQDLARLAESVASDGDADLAVRILWSAALRCFWSEPGAQAREHIVAAAEGLLPDNRDARLLAILAYAAPIERGAKVVNGLVDLVGRPVDGPRNERFLGTAALLVGAFDIAAKLSAASLTGLREQGRLGLLARALAAQAWSSVRLGDLSVAAPAAEEASRLARETDQPFLHALICATQAEIAALRGEYGPAGDLAAEAEQLSVAVRARPVLATVQGAKGLIALGEGRFADAFDHLRRMHDPADSAFQIALRCYAVPELAEAAVRSGQVHAVSDIIRDLEQVARSTSSPALAMGLRYARAVLARDEDAEDLFLVALGADFAGWPFHRARVQLAFGEWLRRQRRTSESRPQLRAARETFDALGVHPLSQRARHELRATGEGSPRRNPDAHDRLTAQELQIARLAAEGLTNREIGQRLYLSHRTVSTHLHRIFPKLGVSSRSDLGAVLHPAPGG
ncbi:LuxR family transcriptional regulator [Actinoplanes sp. ATCC 53533]|uniref:ATP-binding protein n=1 Tax=Actinoplanes sp. ATCC 53533 TaxID=1288362 RepID=UPI000F79266D|nr:LuxR family transcriptional regulator [Actinoplanes sp. ATCC 53533]RSM68769.1 LuxR family transcriptional regulator [Actinoplanes sp. ATCC 53533]